MTMLATSLVATQKAAVDSAVGSLASLPRYRLEIELDPEGKTVKGREQIALTLKEPAREIWLRVPANAAFLDRGSGPPVNLSASVNGKAVAFEGKDPGIYRLPFDAEVPAGSVLVEVTFHATVPELRNVGADALGGMTSQAMALMTGSAGEGGTDFGAFGFWEKSFNLIGFAPEIARRDAGIFDNSPEAGMGEPRWGSLGNWVVSLVAPASLVVAGTGVEVGSTPEPDGRKRTTRVAAAVRGFALLAGEGLQEQKTTAGEVKVRVLASAAHAYQAKKLLDTAARAMRFMSEKAGPYPWTELDLVDAPLTNATEAVSFPTVILASGLLTDPGKLPPQFAQAGDPAVMVDSVLELATAHHVAHQWFKGVVGADDRGRPVLDEPIAAYAGYLYVEQRRGGAQAEKLVEEQMKRAYRLYRTLGRPDQPVDRPLNELSGRLEFEALMRGKGALFFHKLRKLVGDRAFYAAMKEAVVKSRFKEVDTDPVLLAVAGTSPNHADAALKLYDRFMRQTHGDDDIGTELDLNNLGAGMQIDPTTMKMLQQFLKTFGGGGTPHP
jgi:hypothetical protein